MILILDDVRGVALAFQTALKRLAIPSKSAASVAGARAALPQERWTGFILDLELPDGLGIDLLEDIRAHEAWRTTPAVVITANILLDPLTLERVRAAGASLECGAFTTPHVAEICRRLIVAPAPPTGRSR